jgi:hypothetical protein
MGAQQSFENLDPFLIDHIASYLSDSELLMARACCKRLRRRLCPPSTYKLSSGYKPNKFTLLCEFNSCALFEMGTYLEEIHYLVLKWDSPAPCWCTTTEHRRPCGIISHFSTSFGLQVPETQVDAYSQYAITAIASNDMRWLWMLKRWCKDEAIKDAFIRLQASSVLLPWESEATCYEWYPRTSWKKVGRPM